MPTSPGPAAPRPTALIWAGLLAAGLIAGLIAWLGGEAALDFIQPFKREVNSKGMMLKIADRWDQMTAEARNAAVAFVILGGAIGACLGLAGGLIRGSTRRGVVAAFLGLGIGAVGSVLMAVAVLSPYNAYQFVHPDEASQNLLLPLLVHSSIWAVAGLAGGLACGFGFRTGADDRRLIIRAMLGGVIGALVGTIAIDLTGSLIFEGFDGGNLNAATSATRCATRLAVGLGTAAGVALAVTDRRLRPVTPAEGGDRAPEPA